MLAENDCQHRESHQGHQLHGVDDHGRQGRAADAAVGHIAVQPGEYDGDKDLGQLPTATP